MHDDVEKEDVSEHTGDERNDEDVDDFAAAFFGSIECGMRKKSALALRASGAHRVDQEPHECRHCHDGKWRHEARL